jgi:hypothetical protein
MSEVEKTLRKSIEAAIRLREEMKKTAAQIQAEKEAAAKAAQAPQVTTK